MDHDVPEQLPKRRVALVTGGRGFVGTGVVDELLHSGMFDEVRVFDLGDPKPGDDARVNWIKGDMLKLDDLLKVMDGVDSVVHLAAIVDMRYAPYYLETSYPLLFALHDSC